MNTKIIEFDHDEPLGVDRVLSVEWDDGRNRVDIDASLELFGRGGRHISFAYFLFGGPSEARADIARFTGGLRMLAVELRSFADDLQAGFDAAVDGHE